MTEDTKFLILRLLFNLKNLGQVSFGNTQEEEKRMYDALEDLINDLNLTSDNLYSVRRHLTKVITKYEQIKSR
jgi:pyruvate/oxaloacetate carboxyltransferase